MKGGKEGRGDEERGDGGGGKGRIKERKSGGRSNVEKEIHFISYMCVVGTVLESGACVCVV